MCSAVLVTAALPYAAGNGIRPLAGMFEKMRLGRPRLYFLDRSSLAGPHMAAAGLLRASGCRSIGIDYSIDRFQYPVLALLDAGKTTQVRPVGVKNETASLAQPVPFEPCAVLCLGCAHAREKWRQYGSFPRAINYFVKEKGLLTLEKMISKMTSRSAEAAMIRNKGVICDGYDADLVVFDYDQIRDTADYIHSNRLAEGIHQVIIGGEVVYEDGKLTGATPGKILLHNS